MYHNQENIDFPLREKFLNKLKSSNSDLSEIYRHLFTCMESESLESTLNYLKDEVKNEGWFFTFHKSMRQTDFFNDVYVSYEVNHQTEDDVKRLNELRKVLPFYGEKGRIWEDVVKSEDAKELGFEKELNEWRKLKSKAKVEKRRSIGGNLDMALWNLIHLDKENFLGELIENFFKEQ